MARLLDDPRVEAAIEAVASHSFLDSFLTARVISRLISGPTFLNLTFLGLTLFHPSPSSHRHTNDGVAPPFIVA
jgi:hypothetical protein